MSDDTPKSRRNRFCIWCGEMIHKGETYRREKSIYDGHWQDHSWHLECCEAAKEYFRKWGEPEFEPYENERPALDVAEKNRLLTKVLCEKLRPYTHEQLESS
jgi:hypothetical protein